MARTDILLDPDNIDVIAAEGSVNIAESSVEDPTIQINPKNTSIQIWRNSEHAERSNSQSSIKLNGSDSQLVMSSPSQRYGSYDAITLNGDGAAIEVGGGVRPEDRWEGTAGSITIRNAENTDTVDIRADGYQEGENEGGLIRLSKSTDLSTVVIDGGTGTMMLGSSQPRLATKYTGSENGELWLDDGARRKFGLKAENGTIGLGPSSDASGIGLVLKPEEGIFGIVDENGDFVFRIDAYREKIEIPNRFTPNFFDPKDIQEEP